MRTQKLNSKNFEWPKAKKDFQRTGQKEAEIFFKDLAGGRDVFKVLAWKRLNKIFKLEAGKRPKKFQKFQRILIGCTSISFEEKVSKFEKYL